MASSLVSTLVVIVVLSIAYKAVADYQYYYSGSKNTLAEIKKYDTLAKDTENLLKKYTKPKAAGCKTSLTKQSWYGDGPKKIKDKIDDVTKKIEENDKAIQSEAKKCGTGPKNKACVQKATKKGDQNLNKIKKPAIAFIKQTKNKANADIKKYMNQCTK